MAKKNPRSRSSRAAATPQATPATARELGATLGQTIRGAAPDIVNALIEQAKAGNCTPAKFLFDFAGLGSAPPPPTRPTRRAWPRGCCANSSATRTPGRVRRVRYNEFFS